MKAIANLLSSSPRCAPSPASVASRQRHALSPQLVFHLRGHQVPLSWARKRQPFWKPNHARILCAMDASFGGRAEDFSGPSPVFPRINVRDPFKRLGISQDASEEEIQEARNFLVDQYAGHERSREAIEAAYDKIIMESFRQRKRSKINLKSNLKKKVAESPTWLRNIANMIEVPPTQVILQRAAFFIILGVWSVMNPAEGGPAFQVAVSLAGCIYLLNDRLKSVTRSLILGFGALVIGWVFGSFLLPVLPPSILPRSWSLELTTSLISYIFLWFTCTFLK